MAAKTKAAHPLAGLIPDASFYDEYISRTLDNGVSDVNMLAYARLTQQNTLLFGETGTGKTSLVLAYAARDQLPLVTVQCHGGIDPASFWGGRDWNPETGSYTWVDSNVTEVIRLGGVVYLDEVNFMPPKTASPFHSLLDKRRQITILEHNNELIDAHPECQIIAAYNPDYEGTRPLNAAFKNRWRLKQEIPYDPDVEAELLCVPVLQQLAAKLRVAHKAGDLETPVSTNMLVDFEVLAIDLGYDFALTNFLNAFDPEERGAVREAFDLFSEKIGEQVREAKALGEQDA